MLAFEVIAYPNPYVETFSVDLQTEYDRKVNISIHNMNGQVNEQYTDISTLENPEMARGLAAGIYFVTVSQSGQNKTVKVNKLR